MLHFRHYPGFDRVEWFLAFQTCCNRTIGANFVKISTFIHGGSSFVKLDSFNSCDGEALGGPAPDPDDTSQFSLPQLCN
jgi:hypothetical protein